MSQDLIKEYSARCIDENNDLVKTSECRELKAGLKMDVLIKKYSKMCIGENNDYKTTPQCAELNDIILKSTLPKLVINKK